jgi:putative tricarboxylic transport membrane protein
MIMLVFGILGFLMRRAGFEGAPFILAMVLGPIMETSLRQSLLISRGSFNIFFTRPICVALIILTAIFLMSSFITRSKRS